MVPMSNRRLADRRHGIDPAAPHDAAPSPERRTMLPTLYAHPFSSYCQKVLTALYENGTPFDYRLLAHDDPAPMRELAALWPMKRFPVLGDAGRTLIEATIIVEYLDLNHPGPVRLLPDDPHAALDVRMMDRFFDNYVSTPQQKIVLDALRPPGGWPIANGPPATASASPTAARRRSCSMPTGRIGSIRRSRT